VGSFSRSRCTAAYLIVASIYITAFEILKSAIIERIKSFYSSGFDETGPLIEPEYQSEVLSRNKSPLYASLDWLKESAAITDDDIKSYESIKITRNYLAHEIPKLLIDGLPTELPVRLTELVGLLGKIERWWIVNVEIAINPELSDQEVDEHAIIPGTIMGLQMMIDIALGEKNDSRKYIDEFLKQQQPKLIH